MSKRKMSNRLRLNSTIDRMELRIMLSGSSAAMDGTPVDSSPIADDQIPADLPSGETLGPPGQHETLPASIVAKLNKESRESNKEIQRADREHGNEDKSGPGKQEQMEAGEGTVGNSADNAADFVANEDASPIVVENSDVEGFDQTESTSTDPLEVIDTDAGAPAGVDAGLVPAENNDQVFADNAEVAVADQGGLATNETAEKSFIDTAGNIDKEANQVDALRPELTLPGRPQVDAIENVLPSAVEGNSNQIVSSDANSNGGATGITSEETDDVPVEETGVSRNENTDVGQPTTGAAPGVPGSANSTQSTESVAESSSLEEPSLPVSSPANTESEVSNTELGNETPPAVNATNQPLTSPFAVGVVPGMKETESTEVVVDETSSEGPSAKVDESQSQELSARGLSESVLDTNQASLANAGRAGIREARNESVGDEMQAATRVENQHDTLNQLSHYLKGNDTAFADADSYDNPSSNQELAVPQEGKIVTSGGAASSTIDEMEANEPHSKMGSDAQVDVATVPNATRPSSANEDATTDSMSAAESGVGEKIAHVTHPGHSVVEHEETVAAAAERDIADQHEKGALSSSPNRSVNRAIPLGHARDADQLTTKDVSSANTNIVYESVKLENSNTNEMDADDEGGFEKADGRTIRFGIASLAAAFGAFTGLRRYGKKLSRRHSRQHATDDESSEFRS